MIQDYRILPRRAALEQQTYPALVTRLRIWG
jgi:hypothetical protein